MIPFAGKSNHLCFVRLQGKFVATGLFFAGNDIKRIGLICHVITLIICHTLFQVKIQNKTSSYFDFINSVC